MLIGKPSVMFMTFEINQELLKGADHLSVYLNGTQELKKVNSGYGVGYVHF